MTKLERLRAIVSRRAHGETSVEELAYVYSALPELLAVVDATKANESANATYDAAVLHNRVRPGVVALDAMSDAGKRANHTHEALNAALAKLEADDG